MFPKSGAGAPSSPAPGDASPRSFRFPPQRFLPHRRNRRHEPQKLPGLRQELPVPVQPLLLCPGHPPPQLRPLGPVRPAKFRRHTGVAGVRAAHLDLCAGSRGDGDDGFGVPGGPGGPQGGPGAAAGVFRGPAAALCCPDHAGGRGLYTESEVGQRGGHVRAGADPGVPAGGAARGPPGDLGRRPAAAPLLRLERTPGLEQHGGGQCGGQWGAQCGGHRLLLPAPPQHHPRGLPTAAPRPLPHGCPHGRLQQGLCRRGPGLVGREPGDRGGGQCGDRPHGAGPAAGVDVPGQEPGPRLREAAAGAVRGERAGGDPGPECLISRGCREINAEAGAARARPRPFPRLFSPPLDGNVTPVSPPYPPVSPPPVSPMSTQQPHSPEGAEAPQPPSPTQGGSTEEFVLSCTFAACDPQQTGTVPAQRVVRYLRALTGQREAAQLRGLLRMLDPAATGAALDWPRFRDVMSQWIAACRTDSGCGLTEERDVAAGDLGLALAAGEGRTATAQPEGDGDSDDAASAEAAGLRSRAERLAERNQKLQRELEAAEETNARLEHETQRLRGHLRGSQQALSLARVTSEELQELRAVVKGLQEQEQELRGHLRHLEKEQQNLQGRVDELQEESQRLVAEGQQLRPQVRALAAELTGLQAQLGSCSAQLSAHDLGLAQATQREQELRTQLGEHEQGLQELRLQTTRLQQQLGQMRDKWDTRPWGPPGKGDNVLGQPLGDEIEECGLQPGTGDSVGDREGTAGDMEGTAGDRHRPLALSPSPRLLSPSPRALLALPPPPGPPSPSPVSPVSPVLSLLSLLLLLSLSLLCLLPPRPGPRRAPPQ
ncbi:protein KASH5 [Patagioenas fasciata]|uniref:protein KASH5 n=1 Tax=Patagioenas fasciata TaxID=372321 RepID=UPI003A9A60FA